MNAINHKAVIGRLVLALVIMRMWNEAIHIALYIKFEVLETRKWNFIFDNPFNKNVKNSYVAWTIYSCFCKSTLKLFFARSWFTEFSVILIQHVMWVDLEIGVLNKFFSVHSWYIMSVWMVEFSPRVDPGCILACALSNCNIQWPCVIIIFVSVCAMLDNSEMAKKLLNVLQVQQCKGSL
jgi:hypothetical protein